ncbi:5'-methylthioadenosine/adenosylhomocysteine nucleosidase [Desulfospira joergensenii]|uniref:5'-methylthioadenosine/adenosylhomocysteine nucleosidase n=1 Tax=Desulfospira joergensenii TaxID=53329 RepID=UPI0003B74A1A|nr:5'-methylthioadenosine/adenosylhomocysteine nucleosidase [Desulfospira joergensenii]
MIGIIGALGEEVDLVCHRLKQTQSLTKAGIVFCRGKLEDLEVTVVKCGVGKVNAAICTQILADVFQCEKILFGGVAGALFPGLKQGDVVISSHAVQFDIDLTAFGRRQGELADHDRLIEADPYMVQAASAAFDEQVKGMQTPPEMVVGTIVSGDRFISDPDTIRWLQREFSGVCTEMEGGALGYTCKINQIPFVIIRIISDSAGKDAVGEFDSFLSKSSEMLADLISGTIRFLKVQ